jgi:uncharacterized protein YjbI with pentapeptide repeats
MSLRGADLSDANLFEADLDSADLSGANLFVAALGRANLQSADLSGADLRGARGVTNEQLEQQAASLKGATMPNGQTYKEWLKDKEGRKEAGQNE